MLEALANPCALIPQLDCAEHSVGSADAGSFTGATHAIKAALEGLGLLRGKQVPAAE
jgi:hypothetical protein